MKIELTITEEQLNSLKEMLQDTINGAQKSIEYWRKTYEKMAAADIKKRDEAMALKVALSCCPVQEVEDLPAEAENAAEVSPTIEADNAGDMPEECRRNAGEDAEDKGGKYPAKSKKRQANYNSLVQERRDYIRKHSNKQTIAQMAEALGISESAVYNHINAIKEGK